MTSIHLFWKEIIIFLKNRKTNDFFNPYSARFQIQTLTGKVMSTKNVKEKLSLTISAKNDFLNQSRYRQNVSCSMDSSSFSSGICTWLFERKMRSTRRFYSSITNHIIIETFLTNFLLAEFLLNIGKSYFSLQTFFSLKLILLNLRHDTNVCPLNLEEEPF